MLMENDLTLTIGREAGRTGVSVFRNGTSTPVQQDVNGVFAIDVENYCGYALPSTGGPGTNLICLLGLVLTCLAGAGLVMRKRKKVK